MRLLLLLIIISVILALLLSVVIVIHLLEGLDLLLQVGYKVWLVASLSCQDTAKGK